MSRAPITTLAEHDALEDDDVIAGYREGRAGEPEPGDNRSLSFWHGWRNGMADGRHMPIDDAMRTLVAAVVARQRALPAKDPS